MTTRDPFKPAFDSISWAEEGLAEFCEALKAFYQTQSAEIVTEADPDTGHNVRKVKLGKSIPTSFGRKATEVLNNMRHAFDQLTFAARNTLSGMGPNTIYFPWAQSPGDMNGRLKRLGIDERIWDVFAAQEPYPTGDGHTGGDDVARSLARLANDKHTVGLCFTGVSTSFQWGGMSKTVTFARDGDKLVAINGGPIVFSLPSWDPETNEIELARWYGDLDSEGDYNFTLVIAFQDANTPQSMDAALSLIHFLEKAKTFGKAIQGRCVELS